MWDTTFPIGGKRDTVTCHLRRGMSQRWVTKRSCLCANIAARLHRTLRRPATVRPLATVKGLEPLAPACGALLEGCGIFGKWDLAGGSGWLKVGLENFTPIYVLSHHRTRSSLLQSYGARGASVVPCEQRHGCRVWSCDWTEVHGQCEGE